MRETLLLILAAIWLIGVWLRIYRQARFYQIEEYMSRRYLSWAWSYPRRLPPARPFSAWLLGLAFGVIFGEAPDSNLPAVIAIIAALIAVVPIREAEVKKPLVVTTRVKRILFGACLLSAAVYSAVIPAATATAALDSRFVSLGLTSTIGFVFFLYAPIWLVGGNLLMQPVEAYMRRRYLQQAANTLRNISPKIIGITGSYGKTTTKYFLRDILSVRYQTYATPKSYNTLMGISLAINRDLADDYRTEYFVIEMGAYVEGEIARICQLTPPDIAIVTEVGPQHLERFGSLEKLKKAKYEIVSNLQPDGVAVFNWDNPYIREMIAQGYPETRLTVSRELTIDEAREHDVAWIASDIVEDLSGLSFSVSNVATGEGASITTQVVGEHNVTNLLLCIAVAHYEGIQLRDIVLRIRSLQPAESRLVRKTTAAGITIINDAYSANPKGVVSALKVLGMHSAGARLLITPGMIELGELQEEENRKLGLLAAEHATDIILVGAEQTKPILEAIQTTSFDRSRVQVVSSLQDSVAWYQQNLKAGDTILFLNDLPDTY